MSEDKGWSYAVTHRVPATFPPYGLYTKDAQTIYKSMRRPEVSPRGLASAIQMCQFYINRAGKSLPEDRRDELKKAIAYLQTELRYHKASASESKDLDVHKENWDKLNEEIDLSGEPSPALGPNPYLENIQQMQKDKMEAKEQGLKKYANALVPIGKATKVHPERKMADAIVRLITKAVAAAGKKIAVEGGKKLAYAGAAGGAAYGGYKLYKHHTKKAAFGMQPIGQAHPVTSAKKLVSSARGMFTKMNKGEGKDLAIGAGTNKFLNKVAEMLDHGLTNICL